MSETLNKLTPQAKLENDPNKLKVTPDILKKLLKDKAISEDDLKRYEGDVQKATDQTISEIDQVLATKEKEIMQV